MRARITASHNGRTIAQHDYTGIAESDRCTETARFIREWTGNECDSNNADTFKHHSIGGNVDATWTMVDGKLV